MILSSSYAGNLRHLHEYAQDAIAHVRQYGRPNLFITITRNPAWDSMQNLLLPGRSLMDKHDIIACVFRQKLKSLMDMDVLSGMIKENTATCKYTHLALLCNKIISKEIDKDLYEVVTKNMIQ
ncbi:unnamed protein product [Onchocerca flexuosa]|uniref:Helitron_like_N domain-containing protein n=1 Tax=Onchocerca flexuosa TaxID=387005 RepID=A0A183I5Q7_9BILA|nr:unnamed protein product [Onchocerca flexuosa]